MEYDDNTFQDFAEQLEKKDDSINNNEYNQKFYTLAQSDQYVPIFLNFIETSTHQALLFASTKALQLYIKKHWQEIDPEISENIFRVSQNRVNSDPSIKDSISYYHLLKLMGLVIADNIDLLDIYSEFSPDQLVTILNSIFERTKENGCTNRIQIQRKLNEYADVVWAVLSNSQTTQDWFNLLSASTSITPDYEVYFQYIPRITEAFSIPACVPGILSFYEEIIESEYLNIGPNSSQFVEHFLTILLEFTDSILEDESQHSYVYFVWSKLVLYNPKFFGTPTRNEFTQNFFLKLFKVLTSFTTQPDDFFYLIDNSSHLFLDWSRVNDQEMIDYRPQLINFIQFLKDCIESDSEEFTNDTMEKVIFRITKIKTNIIGQLFLNFLKSEFSSVYYFIGNSSRWIRQIFSQPCSKRLLENPPPAYAGICWIRKCAKYCKTSLPHFIHLLFQYSDECLKPATTCIRELSMKFPTSFTNLISELLDSFDDIPLISGSDIICTLMNAIPYSKTNYSDRFYEVLHEYTARIDDLTEYVNFFVDVIEGCIKKNRPEAFFDLARDTFNILLEPLKPNLLEGDDKDQELLCKPVLAGYEAKWITANDTVLMWIENIIYECAVPGHFEILKYFTDLMPSDDIFDFIINNSINMDAELLEAVLHFLAEGFQLKPLVFSETFQMTFFFQFLQNDAPKVVSATLFCLKEMLDKGIIDETVNALLELLVDGLINTFIGESIVLCLQMLLELGQRVFAPSYIAQYILGKLPFQSEKANIFVYHFALPEPKIEDVITAAHDMINVYRKQEYCDEDY